MLRTFIFSIKDTKNTNVKSITITIETENDIYTASIYADDIGHIVTKNGDNLKINGGNFEECFEKTKQYLERFGKIMGCDEFNKERKITE